LAVNDAYYPNNASNYTVTISGPLPQLQTRPTLLIGLASTQTTLSWPLAASNFVLQASPILGQTLWLPVTNKPVVSNGMFSVFLNSTDASSLFRLRQSEP
jgi:hypothetical protein